MNKLWSVVFGIVLLLCGLSFAIAPSAGWWLPEGVSPHSWPIDKLFYIILGITGFFFFLTEGILVVFMYAYSSEGAPKPARAHGWPGPLKALGNVLHDAHRVEMAWTLIPAILLLYIAFAQIGTWAEVKYQKNMPAFGTTKDEDGKFIVPLQVEISARQFEWRLRYPHPDRLEKWLDEKNVNDAKVQADYKSFSRTPQNDDVPVVNELHLWKKSPIVVYLSTRDVIHSFNIPVMRVKQDALPGKVIPVWFSATKANTAQKSPGEFVDQQRFDGTTPTLDETYRWDIPCAELCGWGHYRMIGRVYVHDNVNEFQAWLRQAAAQAHATSGPR